MKQQNHLRKHGSIHHYRIDQALFGLAGLFPDDDKIKDLRAHIGEMPPEPQVLNHAQTALKLLGSYREGMTMVDYANIHHLIHSVMLDLST